MDALSAIPALTAQPLNGLTPETAAPSLPAQEASEINSSSSAQGAAGQSGNSFSNLLGDFVGEVNNKQAAAGDAVAGLMSGQNVSLHQAMISMEEASISFQMMVEVRNKLLDSYQELMRMQI